MKKQYLFWAAWAVVILIVLLCGTTMARMLQRTQKLDNQFDIAVVDCVVHEQLDGSGDYTGGTRTANRKTGIKVENTGNIDAYIRLRLVSYWVDGSGNVVAKSSQLPAVSCTGDWAAGGDGVFYCRQPIVPGAKTPELLAEPIVLSRSSEGYDQVVEVFADAIQSLPERAAAEKWGVTITGGAIQGG